MELILALYKWKEREEREDFEDEDDIAEYDLKTEANDVAPEYTLHPSARVREQNSEDSRNYGKEGKPFYALLFAADDDDAIEEKYFATKEEAFNWCEKKLGLTKVSS